jgi:hypothetical protein
MELSFTAGIILLILIYVFRSPIKQKSEDLERDMKVNSAESGIHTAIRTISVNKEVDKLGDIPDINDVLAKIHGKTTIGETNVST